METKEIIELVFDGLRTLAILSAASVGIYGINSWRKETKWKRKYELAEEVLALTYQVRDDIEKIRNTYHGDASDRIILEKESDEERIIRDRIYIYHKTLSGMNSFKELEVLRYRFEALFKESILNSLLAYKRKLLSYSALYQRYYFEKKSGFDIPDDQIQSLEEEVWRRSSDDATSKNVDKLVAIVEKICRNVIEKG